jgi:VanZ family protein
VRLPVPPFRRGSTSYRLYPGLSPAGAKIEVLPLLLAVILLIVYASLYPWHFVARQLNASPLWILLHSMDAGLSRRRLLSDVAVNICLYVPLGITAAHAFGKKMRHALVALALGTAVSASIEMLQLFTPGRTCSTYDLINNILGTGVGVGFASFLRSFRASAIVRQAFRRPWDSAAVALLIVWLASLVFPFFPVTSLTALEAEFETLAHERAFHVVTFLFSTVTWCAAGRLFHAAGARSARACLAGCLLVIPLQFLVVYRAPGLSDIAGAVTGVLLFFILGNESSRWRTFAGVFLGVVVLRGTVPFHIGPAVPFSWLPFGSVLGGGEWQFGFHVLLVKASFYGTALWLLYSAGMPPAVATALMTSILACLEALQTRLIGHVPEITDPLLAIALGCLLLAFTRRRALRV